VVITAKNKELLLKIFWPFFCHFLVKSAKIRPQIISAKFFFLRPLLSFLAGISATWQHLASVGICSHAGFYLQTKGGVGAIQIKYKRCMFQIYFSILYV
jgi:hypothetical protein